jgi:hypothetical protein
MRFYPAMPEALKEHSERIMRLARARRMTIATVESCTAGSLAQLLSQAEGASETLHGGFIVYTKGQSQGSTMLKMTYLLLAAAIVALPAVAQDAKRTAADQKQCADQFKAADLNNDGVLSRTEIGNAKQRLPSSIATRDRIA